MGYVFRAFKMACMTTAHTYRETQEVTDVPFGFPINPQFTVCTTATGQVYHCALQSGEAALMMT
uniref:Uncharacterized protein n=1 Tax=Anguilla anguilla TaxID=7936 RepID=A0A0E9WU58_ANGAN